MRHSVLMAAMILLLAPPVAQGKIPEDKIKIGVLQDLPQPYAMDTGNGGLVAAQLAASDFEKAYLKGDAEILPGTSTGGVEADVDQVRDWLDKEHVAAVLSSASREVNLRIAKMVEERNRTLLVAEGTEASAEKLCGRSVVIWGAGEASRVRALAHVLTAQGKRQWFLVAEQDPAGVATQAALHAVVSAAGGQIVGEIVHPIGALDFGKAISAIDGSHADVAVLGESDGDLVSMLRSRLLNPPQAPLTFAAPYAQIHEIDEAGLTVANGLVMVAPYYWDADDDTRRFARRWEGRMQHRHVTQNAAEVYAAASSFLHAAKAVDDVDSRKVLPELRRAPITDTLFGTASVRDDGRVVYDLGVYRVKTPDQVRQRWDYFAKVATVPGAVAFPPGTCAGGKEAKDAMSLAPEPAHRAAQIQRAEFVPGEVGR
jgi:branched-chain amino acid transport system substrate-binding protein